MKKILAIDDTPINLELISAILKHDFPDYQVLLSESGIEGIEIAKRELPDAILLDILMPKMNGYEACNILKTNEPPAGVDLQSTPFDCGSLIYFYHATIVFIRMQAYPSEILWWKYITIKIRI